jgi:hypothetical protein
VVVHQQEVELGVIEEEEVGEEADQDEVGQGAEVVQEEREVQEVHLDEIDAGLKDSRWSLCGSDKEENDEKGRCGVYDSISLSIVM